MSPQPAIVGEVSFVGHGGFDAVAEDEMSPRTAQAIHALQAPAGLDVVHVRF
jgi:hypothetical protein